jgi:hypothetical protein
MQAIQMDCSPGFGYLKIVTNDDNGDPTRYSLVHCWYTPTLQHTVISPGATAKRHCKQFSGYTAYKNFITGLGHATVHALEGGSDVVFSGVVLHATLYTNPLIPSRAQLDAETEPSTPLILYLSDQATRVLWHQRLCHVHMRRLSSLHQHVDGIPPIKMHVVIEGCDTCWTCKLRNAARGYGDARKDATVAGQGISLDFGFIVQRSEDLKCYEKFLGLNGESAHPLLADHKTVMLFGLSTVGKAPPLAWLDRWLTQYHPSTVSFRYACMDGGGEMVNNGEVQKLLTHHGYSIHPTDPASSFQNAPGERPHQDIGYALQVLLRGANMENKLWPFAINYTLQISNILLHGDRGVRLGSFTGVRGDVAKYQNFGCLVIFKPPDKRNGKLEQNFLRGFFLGFTGTLLQI